MGVMVVTIQMSHRMGVKGLCNRGYRGCPVCKHWNVTDAKVCWVWSNSQNLKLVVWYYSMGAGTDP